MVTNIFIALGTCHVHNHPFCFLPAILKSVLVCQYTLYFPASISLLYFPQWKLPVLTMFPPAPTRNCEAHPDIPNLTCTRPLNPQQTGSFPFLLLHLFTHLCPEVIFVLLMLPTSVLTPLKGKNLTLCHQLHFVRILRMQ